MQLRLFNRNPISRADSDRKNFRKKNCFPHGFRSCGFRDGSGQIIRLNKSFAWWWYVFALVGSARNCWSQCWEIDCWSNGICFENFPCDRTAIWLSWMICLELKRLDKILFLCFFKINCFWYLWCIQIHVLYLCTRFVLYDLFEFMFYSNTIINVVSYIFLNLKILT